MSHSCWFLLLALSIGMSSADATCRAKDNAQIGAILASGVELNERFKRSTKGSDDAKYKDLRNQVERFGEDAAMPCLRKAVQALERDRDDVLIRQLMDFAVSFENSANETVSEAMATVFAKQPEAMIRELSEISPSRARIALRSIESGWTGVAGSLTTPDRQDRETRLRALRSDLARIGAAK